MSEALNVSTPEELAVAVKGRSDGDLNQALEELGVDTALDKVFEGMTEAFDAGKAGGQNAVVQYDIEAPGGKKTYTVTVEGDKCSFARGAADSPRVTLKLGAPDFLRVVTNNLSGTQAFFTGKLKLQGDMMFAQVQQNWFNQPSP